jgi:hypothetical protein
LIDIESVGFGNFEVGEIKEEERKEEPQKGAKEQKEVALALTIVNECEPSQVA